MIVGYCRQSSREQATCTNALNQQIARVQSSGAQKIYCDIASGRKRDRKELIQLFEDIKHRKITEVIVTRLDRLGRSVIGIQEALDLFLEYHINLTVLDGATDIQSAAGRGTIAIQAAVAQMEADLIGERIRNGLKYNRQMGFATHPPFGYVIQDKKYALHPQKGIIAREAIDLFLEKKSLRGTVAVLINKYPTTRKKAGSLDKNVPCTPSGFRDWLKHPVLRGYTQYKTPQLITIPTHLEQALISETSQEWRTIQTLLKHGQKFRQPLGDYPLSGLVYCTCGASCFNREKGKYYQCYHQLCGHRNFISSEYIELCLINELCDHSLDLLALIESEDNQVKQESPKIKELRQQLAQLELIDNPAVEQAKQEIKNQIARLEVNKISPVDLSEDYQMMLWSFSKPSYWRTLTVQQKTVIYHDLIEKITVENKEVKSIKFKF